MFYVYVQHIHTHTHTPPWETENFLSARVKKYILLYTQRKNIEDNTENKAEKNKRFTYKHTRGGIMLREVRTDTIYFLITLPEFMRKRKPVVTEQNARIIQK